MGKNRLKSSITVFLSLTLTFLLLMVLTFNMLCVTGAEKMRFEIASDVAFNSVLGEYSLYLKDRFDLLYIDASYLSGSPGISRVEGRLMSYMKRNTEEILGKSDSPWGRIRMEECRIEDFETAMGGSGLNMAEQAILYVSDSPHTDALKSEVIQATGFLPDAAMLEASDPIQTFNSYMEILLGMELPKKKDKKGNLIEVPLSDPAEWVYGLAGSDVLFLTGMQPDMSAAKADMSVMISNRGAVNTKAGKEYYDYSENDYIVYLVDKFGCYMNEMDETPLKCSLEYIIAGRDSDYENLREVVSRIFRWRLADNLRIAFEDGQLRAEALSIATMLEVCTLNPAFTEPIADTIVAACAFLETIGDLKAILDEGRVPVIKDSHDMSVAKVLAGSIYRTSSDDGLCYRQYVEIMLAQTDREIKIARTMDLMELETRINTGNTDFCMDWCISDLTGFVSSGGGGIKKYSLRRKYGYF